MNYHRYNNLAKKYFFSDFTEKHYSKLLNLTKEYYQFVPFTVSANRPHVLWRHDVDFSVHRALRLAEIEHKLGIKTTYFFRLHSEFYNVFEKPIYDRIKRIINLGHYIGLHFEYSFYKNIKTKKQLEDKIYLEKKIFEMIIPTTLHVFSFHNPELKNAINITDNKIADMINVYSTRLKSNYHYCSDSMGYWRHERLEDLLKSKSYPRLHILIHPEWWQQKAMSPLQRFERCVNMRAEKNIDTWKKAIKQHNRLNTIWKGKW